MDKTLYTKAYVDHIDKGEEGTLSVSIGSSAVIDREGEVIDQDGWLLDNFQQNSPLLWAHNVREMRPPIGSVTKVWFEEKSNGKNLMFGAKFDMDDEFAKLIYNKYQKGFLNAFSVGFIPHEQEGNKYTKQELIEISAVPVPANPEALVQVKELNPVKWEEVVPNDEKAVVRYADTPTLEDGRDWNADEALERVKEWAGEDENKLKQAFAWYDPDNPQDLDSYKLLHHDVEGVELKTNWRAVATSMAKLIGADDGVDIPEEDRKGVYEHLAKHYKQYEKDTPKFRYVKDQTFKTLRQEIETVYPTVINQTLEMDTALIKSVIRKEIRSANKKKSKKPLDETDFIEAIKIVNSATNVALRKINSKGGDK